MRVVQVLVWEKSHLDHRHYRPGCMCCDPDAGTAGQQLLMAKTGRREREQWEQLIFVSSERQKSLYRMEQQENNANTMGRKKRRDKPPSMQKALHSLGHARRACTWQIYCCCTSASYSGCYRTIAIQRQQPYFIEEPLFASLFWLQVW